MRRVPSAAKFSASLRSSFAWRMDFLDSVREALRQIHCSARLCHSRANQERNLTFRRPLSQRLLKLRQVPAAKFLVQLSDFSRDASRPVTQNLSRIGDALRESIRRSYEIKVRSSIRRRSKARRRSPLRCGKNPTNKNSSFGSPDAANAASEAEGPGTGTTGMWCLHTQRHETICRIGPGGIPASLTNAIFAPCQRNNQLRSPRHLVVFVVADERARNLVVREKFLCVPSVLAAIWSASRKNSQHPRRDVFEIPDQRFGHQI